MTQNTTTQERPELQRGIGRLGFFALAFGSMIGVGWVAGLGSWLSAAGPMGAVVGFLGGGLLMLLIGLCYAELCAALPVTGGEVAYAYNAYGTGKSFLLGWFLAFGYLSVSAFEAISVVWVLGYLVPGLEHWPLYSLGGEGGTVYATDLVLGMGATGAIAWINYRGAKGAAKLQTLLISGFVLVALCIVGVGILGGEVANTRPWFHEPEPGEGSFSAALGGIVSVFVTAPFWFVGFDTIPQGAEEAEEAVTPRTLARMILLAITCATVFYMAVIWAVSQVGPWQNIVEAEIPAAEAFELALGSTLMAKLVMVAALLGLLTSWNGFFLAGTRVLFALGRGSMAAPALGRSHPSHGTPHVAVVVAALFTAFGTCLGDGARVAFIDSGSFCIALAFLGVCFSLVRLRRDHPELERPYRLPAGKLISILAGLGALFLLVLMLPGMPAALDPLEWIILGVVAGLGAVAWLLGTRTRNATDEAERARMILGDYAGA